MIIHMKEVCCKSCRARRHVRPDQHDYTCMCGLTINVKEASGQAKKYKLHESAYGT
jgi:hypothetical protein